MLYQDGGFIGDHQVLPPFALTVPSLVDPKVECNGDSAPTVNDGHLTPDPHRPLSISTYA